MKRFKILVFAALFTALAVPSQAAFSGEDAAAAEYRWKAEAGDQAAQFEFGLIFHNGSNGVAQNFEEAMKWYKLSADQGNLSAMNNIGVLYVNEMNQAAEGFKWVERAAREGDSFLQRVLGMYYRDGVGVPADGQKAASWFAKSCIQGEASSCFSVGYLYHEGGEKLPVDFAKAIVNNCENVSTSEAGAVEVNQQLGEIRAAAEEGRMWAQYMLGTFYEKGMEGLSPDPEEAAKWYRLSAEQGVPNAQYSLGALLEKGNGVLRDEDEAIRWYRRAAAQNEQPAMKALEKYEKRGGPADPVAGTWMGKAWDADGTELILLADLEVERYAYTGRFLFEFVAPRNGMFTGEVTDSAYGNENRVAVFDAKTPTGDERDWEIHIQGRVGYDRWDGECTVLFLQEKEGVEMRFSLARGPLAQAELKTGKGEYVRALEAKAAEGDTSAMFTLGRVYLDGHFNTPKSSKTGMAWLSRGAEMGYPRAMAMLGRVYVDGKYVEKDTVKGIAWLEKAAALGDRNAAWELERIREEE